MITKHLLLAGALFALAACSGPEITQRLGRLSVEVMDPPTLPSDCAETLWTSSGRRVLGARCVVSVPGDDSWRVAEAALWPPASPIGRMLGGPSP